MQLLIKNGLILQSNGTFVKGHIGIDEGKIASLWYGETPPACEDQIDAESFLVSPGFIDTHVHGGMGFDFSYVWDGWEHMEARLFSTGVTSILATVSTLPPDTTLEIIDKIKNLVNKRRSGQVDIAGIHMEGPFLNKNRKGIFLVENIRPGDENEVTRILERANAKGNGSLIKVWTMAPEFAENMALIKTMTAAGISVSIAHTEADYDTAMAAFSAGADRVTHTFNTMPGLHHRYKGIINAAWQRGAFMELITDGYHVSPTIARMFIAATDPGKIVVVSDNTGFSGLPNGTYEHDNQRFIIADEQVKTESGVFAGSAVSMNLCALSLTYWGFSAGTALKMATENPARSIGIFDRKGSIAVGKDADLVILDGHFNVMMTLKDGQAAYRSKSFKSPI